MGNRNIIHRYTIPLTDMSGAKDNMEKNEIKDRLFDVLNDTDNLPIQDIMVNDSEDRIMIYLSDGTLFTIKCEICGNWWFVGV